MTRWMHLKLAHKYSHLQDDVQIHSPGSTTGNHVHDEVQSEDGPEQDNEDGMFEAPPGTNAQPFAGDYFGEYDPAEFDDFDKYTGQQDEDLEGDTIWRKEASWEPPVQPSRRPQTQVEEVDDEVQDVPTDAREQAEKHLRLKTHVVRYPDDRAGAPVNVQRRATSNEQYAAHVEGGASNPYAPFISPLDWAVARWAKMRGPGSTAFTELLRIPGVVEKLGLSYSTAEQLNKIIDSRLSSGRPRFTCREIKVGGEAFDIYYRDVIACIRALFSDPEFSGILIFAPERHYADEDRTIRVYFDMHTGRWWWNTQRELDTIRPGATIVPVIISSDKTQLTLFGSKTAYPVYLTIGNLPKDVRRKPSRRGQILLAYLPSTRLEHVTSAASRRRMLMNLYHACLTHVLRPLRRAGISGIDLFSSDGSMHRGHPLFALHVGDYLEQILSTGTKQGECPKFPVPREEIGDWSEPAHDLRDLDRVLEALSTVDQGYR
ncbi:hypothetical protein BN946_scf184912.g51 [Trametes cinnabarina]|uniref:Uncharacterized protein n=1 Tax=Pycnoporus cinnabarinus TaxID=5643 RepID=A0A060SSN2_PYCCI|nr:hypothetical protein BN946_scf184912.g51 [Trametes cinnabarina]